MVRYENVLAVLYWFLLDFVLEMLPHGFFLFYFFPYRNVIEFFIILCSRNTAKTVNSDLFSFLNDYYF